MADADRALPFVGLLSAECAVAGVVEPFIANVQAAEHTISTVERKTRLNSDQVLQQLAAGLQELGFAVESGKKASERIRRPVLFGSNGPRRSVL